MDNIVVQEQQAIKKWKDVIFMRWVIKKHSYQCLQYSMKAKKNICMDVYLQKREHFSPFVASVDGLLYV